MSAVALFQKVKRALSRQKVKARALRKRAARLGARHVARFADLSSNNGAIPRSEFEGYARTHDAVAIKATEGIGYVNPYFAEQVKWCKELGLLVVPYHFADAATNPALTGAVQEGTHFVETCRAAGLRMGRRRRLWFRRDHLPGCLDYEQAHPEGHDQLWEHYFTRAYRNHTRHGVTKWGGRSASATEGPLLYGGNVVRERFSGILRRLFWLAAYVSDPTDYWPVCVPKRLRFAWQYSDASDIGLGTADASVAYCSVGDLVRLAV